MKIGYNKSMIHNNKKNKNNFKTAMQTNVNNCGPDQ